jgi:hypothetical protein
MKISKQRGNVQSLGIRKEIKAIVAMIATIVMHSFHQLSSNSLTSPRPKHSQKSPKDLIRLLLKS